MIWPLKFLINQMYNGMENELTLDHAFSACLSTKVYEKKTKQTDAEQSRRNYIAAIVKYEEYKAVTSYDSWYLVQAFVTMKKAC